MIKSVNTIEDPRRFAIRVVENGYVVVAATRDNTLDLHDFQRWTDRTYVYDTLAKALEAANDYFAVPQE